MKYRLTRIETTPILASTNPRIGWAVIGGFFGATLLLTLMFLAGPDRPAYTPFFTVATPPASASH
ncbi:hypothetical protein [Lentzea sp. NPDC092896]|uniref:hypothetical protein n=1 Tax=Lentzea sp. NPDC092896 TaxID=3364127 RepID=UPI00380EB732